MLPGIIHRVLHIIMAQVNNTTMLDNIISINIHTTIF